MTQAERAARHEAEIARFHETYGPAYAAHVAALPDTPRTAWVRVANDNQVEAANDNFPFEEAA